MADRLLPAGATESWLELCGGRVRVLRGGPAAHDPRTDRLPVLLLHGGGYDNAAISWFAIFDRLASDRLVIAPDLPGFGYTEGVPATGDVAELADLVIMISRAHQLSRLAVAGISMGGDVALHVALRHPEAVAGLILVAPGGLVEHLRSRATQLAAWSVAQLPDRALFALGRFAGRFSDSYLRKMVHDPESIDPAVRAEFVREARRAGSGIGYGRYNQATLGPWRMRNNLLSEVFRIATPTLFLHGADDPMVDPAGSIAAAEVMPHAELVLVGDCGHWLPIEAPDIFLSEVTDFLVALP